MFQGARLKLTTWYLLIIMLISVGFSLVIYQMVTNELDRFSGRVGVRIERLRQENLLPPDLESRLPAILNQQNFAEEIKERLRIILFTVNAGILFISGATAYFLAGKTLQPIKEMVDEQSRFITDASHELRTPLTSLKSAMEVSLRDKKLKLKDAKNLIADNISEVDKLKSLTDGMLKLTQYKKPNSNIQMEALSLTETLKTAVKKIQPLAKKKLIKIKKTFKDYEIKGNKDSLVDLFVILLDNAVKYSNRHGRITLLTDKTDHAVVVSVKDEGIGIEKASLPHIFDRFYRADTARTRTDSGGYGLGLSIAKKIVQTHKGTITVESTLAKGTTFFVRLPLLK